MGLMYRASIPDNGCLQTLSAPAYNFGTGDFTVAAMIETTAGGVVVARQTAGGAGFALIVNSDGSVIGKAEMVKMFSSGKFKLDEIKSEEFKLRLYGTTAVVNGRSTYVRDGKTLGSSSHTEVWVKRAGIWKAVSWVSLPIKASSSSPPLMMSLPAPPWISSMPAPPSAKSLPSPRKTRSSSRPA